VKDCFEDSCVKDPFLKGSCKDNLFRIPRGGFVVRPLGQGPNASNVSKAS